MTSFALPFLFNVPVGPDDVTAARTCHFPNGEELYDYHAM